MENATNETDECKNCKELEEILSNHIKVREMNLTHCAKLDVYITYLQNLLEDNKIEFKERE